MNIIEIEKRCPKHEYNKEIEKRCPKRNYNKDRKSVVQNVNVIEIEIQF